MRLALAARPGPIFVPILLGISSRRLGATSRLGTVLGPRPATRPGAAAGPGPASGPGAAARPGPGARSASRSSTRSLIFFKDTKPFSIQLQFVTVIHGVIQTPSGGKFYNTLSLTGGMCIGVGNLSGGTKIILQILPRCTRRQIFHDQSVVGSGSRWVATGTASISSSKSASAAATTTSAESATASATTTTASAA